MLDKMKHESTWDTIGVNMDPLELMDLIEKTILAQTSDQYPFATAYEIECGSVRFLATLSYQCTVV